MSDPTETTAETDTETVDNVPRSRRSVLRGSLTALGAVAFGVGATGTAAANGRFNDAPGQGGRAVMASEDFKNKSFTIIERSGSCAPGNCEDDETPIDGALGQCNQGDGEDIFLVAWRFTYDDPEDDEASILTMYTRSNNIETGATYTWGREKVCKDSGIKLISNPEFNPEDPESGPLFIPNPEAHPEVLEGENPIPIDFTQTSYSIGGT